MRRSLVALVVPALSSCASVESAGKLPLLDSPLGHTLEVLWDRHGGVRQWGRFRAVEMRYEGEGGCARVLFPRLLIALDEPDHVFVEEGYLAARGSSTHWRRHDLRDKDSGLADEEDFALRSVRRLFQLPFFLAGEDWGLRACIEIGSDSASSMREFEAQPRGERLLGPFLVPGDELGSIAAGTDRRLSRSFYLSRHPFASGGPYEVTFGDYETIGGVAVATRREHFSRAPGESLPPSHPFERPSRASRTLVWVERLSSLRFLDSAELAAELESDITADLP